MASNDSAGRLFNGEEAGTTKAFPFASSFLDSFSIHFFSAKAKRRPESMYSLPRPSVINVDTVVPPPVEEAGPSNYDQPPSFSDGYFKPRDTINQDVVRSAEAVKRASSMQTPRQMLLTPQQCSWSIEKNPKSPTIVVSPPSEEHLPPVPISISPLPKHRRSLATAVCLALFVVCSVVGLIFLFVQMS